MTAPRTLASLLLALATNVPALAGPRVAGWVEPAWIGDPPVVLPARLDTGAERSSLEAGDIVLFDRDGREWVRFVLGMAGGRETTLERPVAGFAGPEASGDRPVVRMTLCVAGKRAEAEFVIADRSSRGYPVLIGRAFLRGDILVDPSRTFAAADACVGR
ncbi:MAG: RimK/LysX family protein [Pseudomonadota bacterium]|nr:RimK/LysX family protein [Pseudomonadota bacterium]